MWCHTVKHIYSKVKLKWGPKLTMGCKDFKVTGDRWRDKDIYITIDLFQDLRSGVLGMQSESVKVNAH